LASIANWSRESKVAPKSSDLIHVGQDGKVQVLTQDAVVRQATMGQGGVLGGVVDQLDDVKLFRMSLPLGSAIIGLPTGVIIGEVIDGFVSPLDEKGDVNPMNLVAKGVGIYGVLAFGDKLIGKRASQFAAASLIVQVASAFIPIDRWVTQIVKQLKGIGKSEAEQRQYSAVRQGEAVASQFMARQNIGPSPYSDVV